MLGDREREGFFEPAARLGTLVELQAGLPEHQARYQPVSAAGGAQREVLNRICRLAFLEQRLTEAETKEQVIRLRGHARTKVFGTHR